MTKIEEVARAMRERYSAEFLSGGELVPFEKSKARDAWVTCARAAIEAMRTPTEAMLEAMHNAMFVDRFTASSLPMLGAGFEAAIDSALSEGEERG